MTEKFFREFIRAGYIFGIALIFVSLAHSKFFLSFGQFFIAGAWCLERYDLRRLRGFFPGKKIYQVTLFIVPYLLYLFFRSIYYGFKCFFRNKPALIFSSIYLLHVVGTIYSLYLVRIQGYESMGDYLQNLGVNSEFLYALKDLRTKLPLFLLPLFLSTSEAFGRRQFYWLMLLFIASVTVRTFINSWNLFQHNYIDIREISRSVSHIIVSLLISLTLFIIGYLVIRNRSVRPGMKIILGILFAWLIIYSVISKSTTAIVVTTITFIFTLILLLFHSKKQILKIVIGVFILLIMSGIYLYLNRVVRDYHDVGSIDTTRLEQFTSHGNKYSHYTRVHEKENGHYIWLYIQWEELKEGWNKRSKINYDSLDKNNQRINNTLVRYMTSKGYRKDADGINNLTNEDIHNIEIGIANETYTKALSIRGKIDEFLYGLDKYKETGDPSGSSTMQRIEYWKASLEIIRDKWLTGVGTGGMNKVFNEQYEKMHSKLGKNQRWRSHDQFLSILVGFGIFGFIWFLFAIIYPAIIKDKFKDYYFLIFFIISMLAFIPEDTIETQAGATFFAFFYSFFMFGRKEEDPV
ncbi:MAG: O-antigen ligase family protein [Bacteroidetes bacterium]|nr:O-antigen ligase family protein [Bacteroidota bacterium]